MRRNKLYYRVLVVILASILLTSCHKNDSPFSKRMNVLFIGSSYGVNTFAHFPAMATAAGINTDAYAVYRGAMTLHDIRAIIEQQEMPDVYHYSSDTPLWNKVFYPRFDDLFLSIEWDVIVFQRAAPGNEGGSDKWDLSMEEDMSFIMNYFKKNTQKPLKIYFNTCFSRPVGSFTNGRPSQRVQTATIMNTIRTIKGQFDIEVIPSAIAVQNIRETEVSLFHTSNGQHFDVPDLTGQGHHLDTGVGSYLLGCLLYQQICGDLFGLDISDLVYFPSLSSVHGFVFSDQWYTQVPMDIARKCIECATNSLLEYRASLD